MSLSGSVAVLRNRLAGFLGQSHGGRRDLYQSFGYPYAVEYEDLLAMYLRNDIASRIIRAYPQATWRKMPKIRDEAGDSAEKESDSYSPFVEAVEDLFDKHRITHYLERADRLSGIGRFGALYMGFQDGEQSWQPLTPGNKPLLFMQGYPEGRVTITQWDLDKSSPRFGMPLMYSLRGGTSSLGDQSVPLPTINAHWTRVVHLAEFLDEDSVYGTPRLLPVFNRMKDLEKVVGSSAETFWLNARPGLALEADKDARISPDEIKDMKEQAEEWEHQLRRVMAMRGITANQLQAEVADPEPNVSTLLDLIAGTVAIPKRILIGSERGELSSEQDENNWSSRVDERRQSYVAPTIVRPVVTRLIETKNLPTPKGAWWVEWPEEQSLPPEKQALIAKERSAALSSYANSPGAEMVVPIQEFRTDFLGLEPESEYEVPELEDVDEEELEETEEEIAAEEERRRLAENFRRRHKLAANAAPRTLYVRRDVVNAEEILEHYRRQGVSITLPADELHVTIAYSRKPIDWMKVGDVWIGDENGHMTIPAGGPRINDLFGREFPRRVMVLLISNSSLMWRHEDIVRAGASYDFNEYQPHITITHDLEASMPLDRLEDLEPWQGKITLGAEIFEPIVEDWHDAITEAAE